MIKIDLHFLFPSEKDLQIQTLGKILYLPIAKHMVGLIVSWNVNLTQKWELCINHELILVYYSKSHQN